MKRIGFIFSALCLSVLLASGASAQTNQKAWTVLVYMMADNDLEGSGVDDLLEMAKADTKGKANVVIQVDRSTEYDDRAVANIKNFTSTKRLELVPGGFKEISDLGELDGGQTSTLKNFLTWGLKTYPSQRVAIVFWDHGGAWPGFGVDESGSGDMLSIADMDSAIADSLKASGRSKIDLLCYDACLMATYELARTMRTRADYLLASTELEPGHGYDYKALSLLAGEPDPIQFGKGIADAFAAQAKQEGTADEITQSLTDLKKLDALDKAMDAFSAYIRSDPGRLSPILGRSRGKTLDYGKGPRPDEDTQMVDIGNLAVRLAESEKSANALRDQVLAALKTAVLYQVSGRSTKDATGLSIYFPPQRRLYDDSYDSINSGSWKIALNQYFSGGSIAPASRPSPAPSVKPSSAPSAAPSSAPGPSAKPSPAPSVAPSSPPVVAQKPSPAPVTNTAAFAFTEKDGNGTAKIDQDGFAVITGHMNKPALAKVVDGVFSYGIKDGEDYWLIGDAPIEIDDKAGTVEGSWDLSSLVIKQGKNEAYGFLSEDWKDNGNVEYTIPLNYYPSGKISGEPQEIFLVLSVDGDGNVLSEKYFREQSGQYAELKPKKGSIVVPVLGSIDDEGEVNYIETTDTGFDPNKDLDYDFEDVDRTKTELLLYLEVYDAGDAGDYLSFEGLVE